MNTFVWKEAWIPGNKDADYKPKPLHSNYTRHDLKVSDLMLLSPRRWNSIVKWFI